MEIYKTIPSMNKYEASKNGFIRRIGSENPLKPCSINGYQSVSLYIEGVQYRRYVHRLIAETWIADCKGAAINHIDGNKANNNINNLEVVTNSENMYHAYKNGLRFVTEKQRKTMLKCVSKEVVDKQTGIFYDSLAEACRLNNINYSAIRKRIMRNSPNVRFQYI